LTESRRHGRALPIASLAATLAALLLCACSTLPAEGPAPDREPAPLSDSLRPDPVAREDVFVEPEPRTVEDALILDLYTWSHAKDYTTFSVRFPSVAGQTGDLGNEASENGRALAHLLIPPGPGPHATVVVFPILAGSHIVSEMLAKVLVGRGYLVARLERPKLEFEETEDAEEPAKALRSAVMDARRLIDILEWRSDVDRSRIATAGISVGGIMASLLQGSDPRVRASVLVMPGGNVADILTDSRERPIRAFRSNLMQREGLDLEGFRARMQPIMDPLDPTLYATHIDPDSVFFASARLDRIIRPEHTRALWRSLGRPAWTKLPLGHYQLLPFFWWVVHRGADHLDRFFEAVSPAQERRT